MNTMTTIAKYRHDLPQLGDRLFLTDGGLETTMIFREDWDLPFYEAFILMDSEKGRTALRSYFEPYLSLAHTYQTGFVLESPTWRANPDWGNATGHTLEDLARLNRQSILLLMKLRDEYESETTPMPISGCLGPRGDGYDPGQVMGLDEARDYHAWQIGVFEKAGADLVSAITMTNSNEALGIALAAKDRGMPCVISFTLETDGRLPTGQPLGDALKRIDEATAASPAYYMINCAHPTHFADILDPEALWVKRLRAVRANASKCSHEELDNAPELDAGDPVEFGGEYSEIRRRFPHINIFGGCCGTDDRHIAEIVRACIA